MLSLARFKLPGEQPCSDAWAFCAILSQYQRTHNVHQEFDNSTVFPSMFLPPSWEMPIRRGDFSSHISVSLNLNENDLMQ